MNFVSLVWTADICLACLCIEYSNSYIPNLFRELLYANYVFCLLKGNVRLLIKIYIFYVCRWTEFNVCLNDKALYDCAALF
jgi:hypothetical protein